MHKIRDWLYVSNYASATSSEMLKQHEIQAMLQLYQPIEARGIETKYIKLQDGVPIQPHQLQSAIDFIYEQRRKQHRVLSTCGAGISRSVTMAIVALKEIEGLTLFDAYRSVRQHHKKATPDHVHWKSIAHRYGEDEDFWSVWGDLALIDGD